jgi:hypothetical protein
MTARHSIRRWPSGGCTALAAIVFLRNKIAGIAGCCVRAMGGHVATDPAIPGSESRRRIAFPNLQDYAILAFNSDHQNRNLMSVKRKAMATALRKSRIANISDGLLATECPRATTHRTSHPREFNAKLAGDRQSELSGQDDDVA